MPELLSDDETDEDPEDPTLAWDEDDEDPPDDDEDF